MQSSPPSHKRRDAFAQDFLRVARGIAMGGVVLFGWSGMAAAEDGFEDHPVDSVLKGLDLKTDVTAAPDFVQSSRPKGDEDYLPVGQQHPTRTIKVKTHDELKAMEDELDAARLRHDKLSGRKPPPAKPAKSATAASAAPSAALRPTQN